MNKDILREALIISIEQDAAVFSSSEESSHRFSPRFEARMDRMIKKQKKPLRRFTNTLERSWRWPLSSLYCASPGC